MLSDTRGLSALTSRHVRTLAVVSCSLLIDVAHAQLLGGLVSERAQLLGRRARWECAGEAARLLEVVVDPPHQQLLRRQLEQRFELLTGLPDSSRRAHSR